MPRGVVASEQAVSLGQFDQPFQQPFMKLDCMYIPTALTSGNVQALSDFARVARVDPGCAAQILDRSCLSCPVGFFGMNTRKGRGKMARGLISGSLRVDIR